MMEDWLFPIDGICPTDGEEDEEDDEPMELIEAIKSGRIPPICLSPDLRYTGHSRLYKALGLIYWPDVDHSLMLRFEIKGKNYKGEVAIGRQDNINN